jgi:cytochrome c oxidase assembly protein subunit 15
VTEPARYQAGLHRYAVVVACSTAALVFAGGLVTSTGSGLSVPDWPLSFGQVMPVMRGGVLFEHGHRMIATTVGILTIGLLVWLLRREPRGWVRRLGVAALGLVVVQGILGGLTVLLKLPPIVSVAHAGTAELFLCLTAAIALVTSRGWIEAPAPRPDRGTPSLRTLSALTAGVVFGQILLGALVRHSGAGLAIPDFPLAFGRLVPPLDSTLVAYAFAHRVGAAFASACIVWLAVRLLGVGASLPALRGPALLLVTLLALQIFLGALTIWSRRAVVPTTLHLLSGALILVTTVVVALRTRRLLAAPGAPARTPSGAVLAETPA